MVDKKVKIGLYGTNGHQIQRKLVTHPGAELVAVAGFGDAALPEGLQGVRRYASLDQLLDDGEVSLVSLCSPRRRDQAQDALVSLKAGKHVYAEKPCAMTESELDAIIATTRATGMQFHEMAGTMVEQPYRVMREAVQAGRIGDVVQVFAQKSYPWYDGRPADEDIDGGLGRQVGIYIMRFVEHIAGQKITSVRAEETRLGNADPVAGCRMAVTFQMGLQNGGLAVGSCNYLNPLGSRIWGYELVRIFGTAGMVESNPQGATARLVRLGEDPVELDTTTVPSADYFDLFIEDLRAGREMPLSLDDELSPTRWVIRAKDSLG